MHNGPCCGPIMIIHSLVIHFEIDFFCINRLLCPLDGELIWLLVLSIYVEKWCDTTFRCEAHLLHDQECN